MADMNRIVQIKRVDHRGQIGRVRIHVLTGPRLIGPAEPATVVRNAAIPA
jgi:hypothetical protein